LKIKERIVRIRACVAARSSIINGPNTAATELDVKPSSTSDDGRPVSVPAPDKGSQAISLQDPNHDPNSEGQKRFKRIIARFLASWLAGMGVIAVIALMTNLEWARPQVEQAMADSFHRRVTLGHLSWMLGLNGLSIWTNKLSLTESDGKPFVVAGESEIGVAFLPLLQKRVIIKHVEFHHPEVFATQVSPGHWNFSDLLVEGPEIHYVEVDDGVLHLRNTITDEQLAKTGATGTFANTKWHAYDFQAVSLKLVFPKKDQRRPWPFYLSFKLPRQSDSGPYLSEVSLTVLCSGPFEKWMEHPCEIDLRADHIDPEDWRPFLHFPKGADALLSFHYKGKGLSADTIDGELSGTADDITINNAEKQTVFFAPQAKWQGHAGFSARRIDWGKLRVDLAGLTIYSHGKLEDWRTDHPRYAAVVSADLHNLSQLSTTSLWHFLPGLSAKKQPPELSGAAQVELTLDGDSQTHNISTRLKANGIPLGHLLSGDQQKGTPFLSLFKITPNTPIEGQVLIGKDQTISLKDVRIPANGSKLVIQGMINAGSRQHDVQISASDLILDKFDTAQLENGPAPSMLLSGKVDLDAKLVQVRDKSAAHVAVSAKLKDAVFSAGNAELARHLVGNVAFDGTSIKFRQVSGALDNKDGTSGSINLNGFINTSVHNNDCNLIMTGKRVDIGQLVAFCRSAHLPISAAAVSNMSGLAREIEIRITGDTRAPQLTLKLTPENIAYQMSPPKGASLKPVKISGGTIILTRDGLELKDLPVTSQTGKLQLSATFVGQGNWLVPRTVQIKTSGLALEEAQQYLKSPDMPEQTRAVFANMVAPLQLKSAQGKVWGDIQVALSSNPKSTCELAGTVNFGNVNGKVFQQHVPFEHLSGAVTVADNQLQLRDISFSSGSSHFDLQGDVRNIQQAPAWNLQIIAQFHPDDILSAFPQLLNDGVSASSSGPLTLRSTVIGDAQSNRIMLSAQAHPGCALQVHSPMCQFLQPIDKSVTLDGDLGIRTDGNNNNNLRVDGWHLVVGDSDFQASGKYQWTNDGSRKPTSELVVSTKNAVPTSLILSSFFPATSVSGCSGSIKGTLAFSGPADNLLTHGNFTLSKVTVPAWNLKDADGRLFSPRWSLSGGETGGSVSQIQVQIANATVGGVPASDLSGTIVMEKEPQPKLSLSDGAATVAGGKVKVTAFYQPETTRWRLDMTLDNLRVDEFVFDLIDQPGEVTGFADGHIGLESKGRNWNEIIGNMFGSGEINVDKGRVPKVAKLQERLTQANLLQQGIFGFNLNNVFQTVLPVKAGKFKEVNMSFDIANGIVDVDRLNFVGNDLRLRAAGSWNISANSLSVEVAGNIPRVASSILPGAVGEVSRNLTIQKAVRVVTFHKLESLPTVPILGDIGTDDPRAFTFKIACLLNNSNAMAQSISKSFRWLPNKPNASAHPVPGLPNLLNLSSNPNFSSNPLLAPGF
jgi:AsmA-like C-terminal region